MDNWFRYEYATKDYEKKGINMILGDADIDSILTLSESTKQLLAHHNYALDLFNKQRVNEVVGLPYARFVMVYPQTDMGVRWQVRAYTTKKKPLLLHNFTYPDTGSIELTNKHLAICHGSKLTLITFTKMCWRTFSI